MEPAPLEKPSEEVIEGTELAGVEEEVVLEFNPEAESIEEEEKRLDRPLTRREKNIINGKKGGRPKGS